MARKDWDERDNSKKLPVKRIEHQLVLSQSQAVHDAVLLDNGITANSALLVLAAAGLDIMLPNAAVNLRSAEEIEEIKSSLATERAAYLQAIADLAKGSFEQLQGASFAELLLWAENHVALEIAPKARSYEVAVSKYKPSLLRRAGYSFWTNGVPAIGAAYLGGGLLPSLSVASVQTLQAVVSSISGEERSLDVPEVSYAMKIAKARK